MAPGIERVSFPRLDPLRALCALAVMGNHAFHTTRPEIMDSTAWRLLAVGGFGPGTLGVNVFFTLSGFLITYLLVRESRAFGRIDVPRFWLRRVLRIWPLYYLIVGIGFLLVPMIKHALGIPEEATDQLGHFVLFISNIDKAHSIEPTTTVLNVLWSIAVEEQFYLVWPLLVVMVGPRVLPWLCGVIIMGSIVFRGSNPDPAMQYWHSLSCMGDLAMGALGATVLLSEQGRKRVQGWGLRTSVVLHVLLLLLYQSYGMFLQHRVGSVLFPALFSMVAMAVILVQAAAPPGPLHLPSTGMLAYMGRISYGLYCLHMVALLAVLQGMHRLGMGDAIWHVVVFQPLLTLAITIGLATISHRYLERPFLKLKERFAHIHRV